MSEQSVLNTLTFSFSVQASGEEVLTSPVYRLVLGRQLWLFGWFISTRLLCAYKRRHLFH